MSNTEKAWISIKLRDIKTLKSLVTKADEANASFQGNGNEISFLLHCAAAYGSIDCLKYLIECGAKKDKETTSGYTVVHWAAYGGWDSILAYLAAINFNMSIVDKSEQNALHIAASRGHLNCVKLLAELNVPIDRPAEYRWTPLHFAIAYGHRAIAEFLVERGASIKGLDSLGRTPEILAKEYNRNWWDEIIGRKH